MKDNGNLQSEKVGKNDEFYTQLVDIEKELTNYEDTFKGNVVYCNCDDARVSNFAKYFKYNFERLGLKKLICTGYKESNLFQHQRGVLYVYEGGCDKDDNVEIQYLKGDGDFRSLECIKLLKESDIVVTNPPFILFREYITQIIKYDKKFIILGNMNAITYKEVFPYNKENKLWCGCNFNVTLVFNSPYGNNLESNKKYVSSKGYDPNKYIKIHAIAWFTNIEHRKRLHPIELHKKYDSNEYQHYDNYDAINVDKVCDIPCDYDGVIGVPITFLDKYCPEQFEIIGHEHDINGNGGDGLPEGQFEVNGIGVYKRILIKRKK